MKNDYTFEELICPRCGHVGMKQIPNEWTEHTITAFYEDWYFCTNCSFHKFIASENEKSYA
jgi:ribosomal protein S27AE